MAAEDDDFLFGAYLEDDEDLAAAAAKEERAKRKEAGDWKLERIVEASRIQHRELCKKYMETLEGRSEPNRQEREAPQSAMRHVGIAKGGPELYTSLNVLAIKLLTWQVQCPVDVYGHVLLRDDLDAKRVFIFRRNRDNCQRISSAEDALLSLTGPCRGILLHANLLIEINLKIKNPGAVRDTEIANCRLKDELAASTTKLVRSRFLGEVCSVEMTYTPVREAVEATFQFTLRKIMKTRTNPNGSDTREWQPFNKNKKEHCKFVGKITVSITGVPECVVLYDSITTGSSAVGEGGIIKLPRRVVAVPMGSCVSIKTVSLDGQNVASVFPRTYGNDSFVAPAGSYSLGGTIVWSTIYSSRVDGIFEDIKAVKRACQPALIV